MTTPRYLVRFRAYSHAMDYDIIFYASNSWSGPHFFKKLKVYSFSTVSNKKYN